MNQVDNARGIFLGLDTLISAAAVFRTVCLTYLNRMMLQWSVINFLYHLTKLAHELFQNTGLALIF